MSPRSKSEKSIETRARIFESAITLFRDADYDCITMRDIARSANISAGAIYYYFKSKDEIVIELYRMLHSQSLDVCRDICAKKTDFGERLSQFLDARFKEFEPYKKLFSVLFAHAASPDHHLSPFGAHTADIRTKSISLYELCISGSSLRLGRSMQGHAAIIFWLYQMGLIFYWLHDRSQGGQKTKELRQRTLHTLIRLVKIANLPLMSRFNSVLFEFLGEFSSAGASH